MTYCSMMFWFMYSLIVSGHLEKKTCWRTLLLQADCLLPHLLCFETKKTHGSFKACEYITNDLCTHLCDTKTQKHTFSAHDVSDHNIHSEREYYGMAPAPETSSAEKILFLKSSHPFHSFYYFKTKKKRTNKHNMFLTCNKSCTLNLLKMIDDFIKARPYSQPQFLYQISLINNHSTFPPIRFRPYITMILISSLCLWKKLWSHLISQRRQKERLCTTKLENSLIP